MEAFLTLCGVGIALYGLSFVLHGSEPLIRITTNHYHGDEDEG